MTPPTDPAAATESRPRLLDLFCCEGGAAREAMGMPWASWRGCAAAIPPAYTELIGLQLLAHVRQAVAA